MYPLTEGEPVLPGETGARSETRSMLQAADIGGSPDLDG